MALFVNCFCAFFGAIFGAGLAVCVIGLVAGVINKLFDR